MERRLDRVPLSSDPQEGNFFILWGDSLCHGSFHGTSDMDERPGDEGDDGGAADTDYCTSTLTFIFAISATISATAFMSFFLLTASWRLLGPSSRKSPLEW